MAISDAFHIFYEKHRLWENNSWLGIPMWKLPMDVIKIQEVIYKVKPDFIVETGTGKGGSAVFYASLLELMGFGMVITVDINMSFDKSQIENEKIRNRITQFCGSSTSELVFKKVKNLAGGTITLVLLDSWHSYSHVLKELELYSQLISVGSFIIVEDTHVSKEGNPVKWEYNDFGPGGAVSEFLKSNENFVIDEECENQIMTFNPNGWIRRIK